MFAALAASTAAVVPHAAIQQAQAAKILAKQVLKINVNCLCVIVQDIVVFTIL